LGRFGNIKDNIKIDNKCVGYERVDWIQLTHDRVKLLEFLKISDSQYFDETLAK
jgi:hypothetical protein